MSECCSYDLVEWGAPFERRERRLPEVPEKAVLVKITAAGLCHSDLHIKKGFMDLGAQGKLTFTQRGATLPLTLGHEIAGIVEAVGEKVESIKKASRLSYFPGLVAGIALPVGKIARAIAPPCALSAFTVMAVLPAMCW